MGFHLLPSIKDVIEMPKDDNDMLLQKKNMFLFIILFPNGIFYTLSRSGGFA